MGTEIERACCYGSGLIGSGWATNFILAGVETKMYDLRQDLLNNAAELVKKNLTFFLDEGLISQEQMDQALGRLVLTTDPEEALKDVQFVQENTPERIEIKRSAIAVMEKYCGDTVVIASSTSGLLISDIAAAAKHPERFVGAHPYNPVYLLPLVEVTRGKETSDEAVNEAYAFYKQVRMEPVVLKKEAFGFIANRLQHVLYREAADLVYRGVCTMEDVDRAALFGPGLRWGLMGPNMVFQLGGGAGGIEGLLKHMGPTMELCYKDACKWDSMPMDYIEKTQPMMDEIMKQRAPETGNTNEEIELFRDRGLLMLLKYHGKFKN